MEPRSRSPLVICALAGIAGCSKREYKMPAGSMIPTLEPGSSISVDRSVKSPTRGEVWAYKDPESGKPFAKRLVAGPGDRVESRGGAIVINGKPLPACVIGRYQYTDGATKHEGDLVLERSEAAGYLTFQETLGVKDPAGPWEVKPGEWFAVGDNRRNSNDSRFWNGGQGGGVPLVRLLGRVELRPVALPAGAEGLATDFARCKSELGVL